ncbi:hypothetical protein [Streptacidiphilus sp. P02-A3a]|uniref:hypothetical protein n=1 Tax=Streptacidiphilus sp. P02-A3a TaxID=2704468 RepID=UPI0015FE2247|nr:hypothetical protein [Streptacidiphilus sp. P02-A3a]QMU71510.1 hypothetical protein GXP74_28025 [Streptacidiphilus sp. P02-A3a]
MRGWSGWSPAGRVLFAGFALALALTVLVGSCSGARERDAALCPGAPAGSCAPSAPGTPGTGGGPAVPGRSGPASASGSASGSASAPALRSVPASRPPSGPGSAAGPAPRPKDCPSPGACGFPDAASTGPRIPLTPHRTGALEVTRDGETISGWDITGSLDVYADDVTVVDSRITSTNWWGVNLRPGYHGLRILHSTITAVPGQGPDNGGEDYAVSNMGDSSIEVGWSDISVFGNALSMGQGYLHDDYVHDLAAFHNASGGWQHLDAVISDGGGSGGLTVRHNTLLDSAPADQGASASVGLYADTGVVSNAAIEDNWLAGGAYALYGGGAGATGITVTGNVFSTQYHPACGVYGTVAAWNAGGAGNVWSDNELSDGTPVTPGPPS